MSDRAKLLTPQEVADILQVPVGTLSQWRYRRIGPPYVKIVHHVRYRDDVLYAWIEDQRALLRGG